jgi:hypothetical protein
MYFIPKNIKVKREIFKGFGILEILAIAISLAIGYLLSLLARGFYSKLFLFSIIPFAVFILLLPLPNSGTALNILIKFIKYKKNQKNYKKYN